MPALPKTCFSSALSCGTVSGFPVFQRKCGWGSVVTAQLLMSCHFCQALTGQSWGSVVWNTSTVVVGDIFSSFGILMRTRSFWPPSVVFSILMSSVQRQKSGSKLLSDRHRSSLARKAPKNSKVAAAQIRRFSEVGLDCAVSAVLSVRRVSAVAGWRVVALGTVNSELRSPCMSIFMLSERMSGQITPCCRCSCLMPARYTLAVACDTLRSQANHSTNLTSVSGERGRFGEMFFSLQQSFSILLAVLYELHVFWARLWPLNQAACLASFSVREGLFAGRQGLAGPNFVEPFVTFVVAGFADQIPVKLLVRIVLWLSAAAGRFWEIASCKVARCCAVLLVWCASSVALLWRCYVMRGPRLWR